VICLSISIRYLAHASFVIKVGTQNIYIDPSTKDTGLRKDDFGPADLILVTHSHADHCDPDLVKKIRKGGKPIIAPESCRKALIKAGVMWPLQPGEMMQMGDGVLIRALPAYNVKRGKPSGEPYHPKDLGSGYLLTINGKKIYHAGSTDLVPEMEQLGKIPRDVDVAMLPCDGTYTMDVEEASKAAMMINPKVVIPMHLRSADPKAFKEKVESKSSIRVVILQKGEEFTLE
jgi:L-ascorbate metabolism protein UlaG (beta-lactamase superfamily)